jgi:hypothetical protein
MSKVKAIYKACNDFDFFPIWLKNMHFFPIRKPLGPCIFTKLRRRKRRTFVCTKIGKITLEQRAQLDSTWEVKLIYDVFALLVSTTQQINVCKVCIYVYVHAYEL